MREDLLIGTVILLILNAIYVNYRLFQIGDIFTKLSFWIEEATTKLNKLTGKANENE